MASQHNRVMPMPMPFGYNTVSKEKHKEVPMVSLDFTPKRVCPSNIHVELSDDGKTIQKVEFTGGCNGNTKAVAKLVAGHSVDEIVALLAGNDCKNRGTSCADQMTIALQEAQKLVA